MPEKKPEKVWMKCRAKRDNQIDSQAACKGNEAVVVFRRKLGMQQGGGTVTRYRCTSCNGAWHTRL